MLSFLTLDKKEFKKYYLNSSFESNSKILKEVYKYG